MKIKSVFLSLVACLSCNALSANLINDMQGCQALIDHVNDVLDKAPDAYAKKDVKNVQKGLELYNDYIQNEIVTPGLVKFNGGDKEKAKAMQAQVDDYKKTVISAYDKKYKNKLYTDHAVAINECAKKAVPSGDSLEALKLALTTMVELAKLK